MKCRDCKWCYTNETMSDLYICVKGNSEMFGQFTGLMCEDECKDGETESEERGMKRYRFKSFKCKIYKDWIYLLPSIVIHTEDMKYYPPEMLSISIHFIILHLRWLWLRKEQE